MGSAAFSTAIFELNEVEGQTYLTLRTIGRLSAVGWFLRILQKECQNEQVGLAFRFPLHYVMIGLFDFLITGETVA